MKRPPELSFQDKAILISLPIVILVIMVLTNYLSQDATVEDAFAGQMNGLNVRDGGRIIKVYPQTATSSVKIRLQTLNGARDFDFVYNLTASETLKPELGGIIQFYGQYTYDANGGTITVPYKGKSGQIEAGLLTAATDTQVLKTKTQVNLCHNNFYPHLIISKENSCSSEAASSLAAFSDNFII